MSKIFGIFGRAAALSLTVLLMATLFGACPLPELNFGNQDPDFQPRAGVGYISLNIGNPARTILPTGLTSIGSYTLTFTESSTVTGDTWSVSPVEPADLDDPIEMEKTGSWWLVVTAYASANASGDVVASSAGQTLTISAGVNSQVAVDLIHTPPTNDDQDDGTFSYEIDLTGLNSTVAGSMAIAPVGGTLPGTYTGTINFNGGNVVYDDTIDPVAPGYYWVTISLTATIDSNIATYNRIHALHIYQNMDSLFEETLTAANFFLTPFDVTFNFNDGTRPGGATTNLERRVMPGGTVPLPTTMPPGFQPNGTDPAVSFFRWFTTANNAVDGGSPTTFTAATPVTRTLVPSPGMSLVVWAQWVSGTPEQPFEFTLLPVTGLSPVPTAPASVIYGASGNITLADGTLYSDIKWYVNGAQISGATAATLAVATGDAAADPFNVPPLSNTQPNNYTIYVTAMRDGVNWSAEVILSVIIE